MGAVSIFTPVFRDVDERTYITDTAMVIASRMMETAVNEEGAEFLRWGKWANNAFNLLANAFWNRGTYVTDSINVTATREICRALSKEQLLVYASTTSLYGAGGGVSSEETEVCPVSHYGVAKLQAEQVFLSHEQSISLRWPTIFGVSPRMRTGLLIHDFVQKAVQEGTVVLFAGDSRRTFLHVEDSAAGYVFALEHAAEMAGQIFNVNAETLNASKRQIAELVKLYSFYDPASPVRPI